jgi:hypothetical protein
VVVLSSETHLSFVKSLVEADCLIMTTTEAQAVLTPALSGGCSLCLLDGRVVADTAQLLISSGVTRILGTTQGIWRKLSDWTHSSWQSAHWNFGGMTTTTKVAGVCLLLGSDGLKSLDIAESVGQDAGTVLLVKAPARKYRPAPTTPTMSPLGCTQLGTPQFPVYHGGGLLPECCSKWTIVLAPGLFAPKGNWAQRNLTVEEILIAKDCGHVAADLLGAGTLTNTFLRSLLPVKCLIGLANRWECNNGGVTLFSPYQQMRSSQSHWQSNQRRRSLCQNLIMMKVQSLWENVLCRKMKTPAETICQTLFCQMLYWKISRDKIEGAKG